jgi:hypothetical protein
MLIEALKFLNPFGGVPLVSKVTQYASLTGLIGLQIVALSILALYLCYFVMPGLTHMLALHTYT